MGRPLAKRIVQKDNLFANDHPNSTISFSISVSSLMNSVLDIIFLVQWYNLIIKTTKTPVQESPVYLLKKHREALDSLQSYRNVETDKDRYCDVGQS